MLRENSNDIRAVLPFLSEMPIAPSEGESPPPPFPPASTERRWGH